MDAAARVVGSDVVAGRGDLLRGGRGREGRGTDRREPWGAISPHAVQPELGARLRAEVEALLAKPARA